MSKTVPCPEQPDRFPYRIPGYEHEAEFVVEEADEGVERHIDGVVSEGLQGGPGTYDIRTLKGAFKKGVGEVA